MQNRLQFASAVIDPPAISVETGNARLTRLSLHFPSHPLATMGFASNIVIGTAAFLLGMIFVCQVVSPRPDRRADVRESQSQSWSAKARSADGRGASCAPCAISLPALPHRTPHCGAA